MPLKPTSPSHPITHPPPQATPLVLLQYGAHLGLVELVPADEQVWRQRVEQRGGRDRGTEREHKPHSWADVEAMRARNGDSEAWSSGAHVPLRCTLDSTGTSTEEQVRAVLSMLGAPPQLPPPLPAAEPP